MIDDNNLLIDITNDLDFDFISDSDRNFEQIDQFLRLATIWLNKNKIKHVLVGDRMVCLEDDKDLLVFKEWCSFIIDIPEWNNLNRYNDVAEIKEHVDSVISWLIENGISYDRIGRFMIKLQTKEDQMAFKMRWL